MIDFEGQGRPQTRSSALDQGFRSALGPLQSRRSSLMSADWGTADLPMSGKPAPRRAAAWSFDDDDRRASEEKEKARLAVILPRHRLWEWHRQLLLHLEKTYDVTVFLDDGVRSYRRATRLWLKLERLTFPGGPLARPIVPDGGWRSVSDLKSVVGDIVINLSERPQPHAGALELRYGGVLDSSVLIETLMAQEAPYLAVHGPDQGRPLAASRLAIEDKFSIGRGLQDSFSRCLSLVDRALSSAGSQLAAEAGAVVPPPRATFTGFIPRMIAHKASSLLMGPLRRQEHWRVALRHGAQPFHVIQDDGERFYADPFLHRAGGRTFLFVEEYAYADRKGIISVAEVVDGRPAAAPVAVLDRPYHLSYPFVFEHEGEFWMIPETGENRSIELYRATEFPWKWTLSKILMQGAAFSDATVLFHDGLWWLFATADRFGGSTQDELSIFYSEALQGEWKPHRANPAKSDSRFSRPAGRIVQQSGRLFRPAQDCDRTYGAGIVWFEITELTTTGFSERKIAHWDGRVELSMDGCHSFDQLDALQVIDFKCSAYCGLGRKNITTITPRADGEFERSFSKSSCHLQFDRPQSARSQ